MSAKVFVANLSHRARERDVEDFFHGFGKIREIVLKNGYGFVEFDESRDANDAIRDLNGRSLCGEKVRLELSRRRRSGDDRRGSYRHDPERRERREKYGAPYATKYRLLVDNLSTRCSWQELKDLMRGAGEVTYAEAHRKERRQALVCFASASELRRAIYKYDGKEINGRRMKLTDDSVGREASRSRSPRFRSRRSRSAASPDRKKSRASRSPSPPRRSAESPGASRRKESKASRSRSPKPRRSRSRASRSPSSPTSSVHSSPRAPPARRSQSPTPRDRSPTRSPSRDISRDRSQSICDELE